jgi:DNA polymerase (family 10)
MNNDDVAQRLQETADLLELTGGNQYRARAFSRAARSVTGLEETVADRLRAGTLVDVTGIGESMAEHVADILHGGSFKLRDELLSAVPPGVTDVLRVKGLGTKRTRRLWQELDVTSLDELEAAAESGRVTTLDGFGDKTQQKILDNVRQLRRYDAQWRLADAWPETQSFLDDLRAADGVERAEVTGALRRHQPTVEEPAVLVSTQAWTSVQEWLSSRLEDLATENGSVVTGRLPDGMPIRIHHTTPDRFGTAWWRTTGTPAHCAAVEELSGPLPHHPDEGSLYRTAGLAYVAPALRENRGEVEAAADDQLPSLLRTDDLEGCLHNHSTYSDGAHSLREMAEAARDRGYSYFGICDHSQSLQIADGLSPEEVRCART